MGNKYVIYLILVLVFSSFIYAEVSSSTINWASKRYVDNSFCMLNGNCTLADLIVNSLTILEGNLTFVKVNFQNVTIINQQMNGTLTVDGDLIVDNLNASGNISADKIKAISCTTSEVSMGTAGNCVDLNQTILDITATIKNLPKTFSVQSGTCVAGCTIAAVNVSKDGASMNISESAGASPLTVIYNFTNVLDINNIVLRTFYADGGGHQVAIGLLDFTTGLYEEEYGNILNQGEFDTIIIDVTDATDHIQGGVSSLRLRHIQNGNPSHILRVDYAELTDGFSTVVTHDHDALSGRDSIGNHPQYLDLGGSRNLTRINVTGDAFITDDVTVDGAITATGGITGGFLLSPNYFIGTAEIDQFILFRDGGTWFNAFLQWDTSENDFFQSRPLRVNTSISSDSFILNDSGISDWSEINASQVDTSLFIKNDTDARLHDFTGNYTNTAKTVKVYIEDGAVGTMGIIR